MEKLALNKFEMKIEALTKNEAFARSTVAAFAVELNPTLEEVEDIKTAVSEAVTNCIVHGYGRAEGKEIGVSVCLYLDEIEIIITDEGCGICDLEQAMQPFFTTKPDEERSGMGFTLMSSYMDGLKVDSAPGRGTTVRMVKKIGAKEA